MRVQVIKGISKNDRAGQWLGDKIEMRYKWIRMLPSHHNATSTTLFLLRLLLGGDYRRSPVGIGCQAKWGGVLHLGHRTVAGACIGPRWLWSPGLGRLFDLRWLFHRLLLLGLWRHRGQVGGVNSQRCKVAVVCIWSPSFLLPLFLLHLLGKGREHLLVRWETRIRLVHGCQPWGITFWPISSSGRPHFTSGGRSLRSVARHCPRSHRGSLPVGRGR